MQYLHTLMCNKNNNVNNLIIEIIINKNFYFRVLKHEILYILYYIILLRCNLIFIFRMCKFISSHLIHAYEMKIIVYVLPNCSAKDLYLLSLEQFVLEKYFMKYFMKNQYTEQIIYNFCL